MVFDWRCPSVRSNSARDLGSFTFLGPKAAVWVLWHLLSFSGAKPNECLSLEPVFVLPIWWKYGGREPALWQRLRSTHNSCFFPGDYTYTEYLNMYCISSVVLWQLLTLNIFEPLKHMYKHRTSVTFLCDRLELRGLVWCILFNI